MTNKNNERIVYVVVGVFSDLNNIVRSDVPVGVFYKKSDAEAFIESKKPDNKYFIMETTIK